MLHIAQEPFFRSVCGFMVTHLVLINSQPSFSSKPSVMVVSYMSIPRVRCPKEAIITVSYWVALLEFLSSESEVNARQAD